MPIHFTSLPTETVRALQAGGPDFWGNAPERRVADGISQPCRHCLSPVPQGQDYLTISYRPFTSDQPFAEVGPIFLCAEVCEAPRTKTAIPASLNSETYLIKGYTADERIRYGTGRIVPTPTIPTAAQEIFKDKEIAFVDVRSASNNCFHTRIVREPSPV
ncbi:DUF1203 domain-containing protein [Pontivivens insulae]|uniref:DUF1203 domain-containing protein n=1 Tax=Pontivivens insulae TaxID=1639689 RepID=A0A2R8A9N5_9RHOB|nr:DUF1203 domain-containing protein [Pontivivens insulae]RED12856.1 uncharacterized protein DUF1203 [Pontivivens insulae]SPF28947.1 hypothetical protein POI8812_01250 [Pontivivens insulae]